MKQAPIYRHRTSTRDHCFLTACALIVYAAEDDAFRMLMRERIKLFGLGDSPGSDSHELYTVSRFLIPRDDAHAYELMQWVLSEIARERETTIRTRDLLYSWSVQADEKHTPKNLVLGIVGLAIIGPTLGLIKKRKNDAMRVILRSDAKMLVRKHFFSLAQRASVGLLETELRRVGGIAYRLHPDIAHWFFGEKRTELAYTNTATLSEIIRDARDDELPHVAITDERGIAALALSPQISDMFLSGKEVTPL